MTVEVVVAREKSSVIVELGRGATLMDAVAAAGRVAGDFAGYAIHGERATLATRLHAGDRVELLEPLLIDPKDARRRRAGRA